MTLVNAWPGIALLLAGLILAGCGLNGPAHAPPAPIASAVVDMGLADFSQPTVTIRAGQTVEWRNTSILTHTVTADPSVFDSGNVAAGEVYLHRFDTPGTYQYLCTHHADLGMAGTVIVAP